MNTCSYIHGHSYTSNWSATYISFMDEFNLLGVQLDIFDGKILSLSWFGVGSQYFLVILSVLPYSGCDLAKWGKLLCNGWCVQVNRGNGYWILVVKRHKTIIFLKKYQWISVQYSFKVKISFVCTFGFLCNITKHFTSYDSKKPLNPESVWMRGCEFSKLSCRTRWLGNEHKKAELLGSKLHQYLPEFM